MSKIRSDLRVRGIARVRGDRSKTSGSDSKIRSDFGHFSLIQNIFCINKHQNGSSIDVNSKFDSILAFPSANEIWPNQ